MGLKKYIKNPGMIFFFLGKHECLNWISDKAYIRLLFKVHFGYNLNLENPKTYNEKLQWLKLHNRNPQYAKYADKYEVIGAFSSGVPIAPISYSRKFSGLYGSIGYPYIIDCTILDESEATNKVYRFWESACLIK